ncbi:hypothetical protein BJ138DRAFT_1197369 [Hygrophoropsis aurantiaca]|uniref:Uncharacterized protein n=1 Tax=Hygrophoropsis aurantiaca TaxID=72124 RepID=A0ACB7ZPK0_9AGAM|nr:hypothetical protein BJ138DRAFT_1197369 [Hygrophoropsis aurantiaca]
MALLLDAIQISILELLRTPIPEQSTVLVQMQPNKCFSILEPNEDLECLKTRKIPPAQWLEAMEKAFGQAWFDGAKSIIDFSVVGSRLPLWTLTYWKEISLVFRKKALWNNAHRWLARMGQEGNLYCLEETDQARHAMGALCWGAPFHAIGGGTGPEALLPLLSDAEWLDDDIINLSMRMLSERAQLIPELSTSTLIAPLLFSTNLQAASEGKLLPHLDRYTSFFKSGQRKILYFPAHVNNNHWVAFRIDFKRHTLEYGDSLMSAPKPTKVIQAALDWLKKNFDVPFHNNGPVLPHGIQLDQNSCGLCVVNTISHNLFGDELFTHGKRKLFRINLFTELANTQSSYGIAPKSSSSRSSDDYQSLSVRDLLAKHDHNYVVASSTTASDSGSDSRGADPISTPQIETSECSEIDGGWQTDETTDLTLPPCSSASPSPYPGLSDDEMEIDDNDDFTCRVPPPQKNRISSNVSNKRKRSDSAAGSQERQNISSRTSNKQISGSDSSISSVFGPTGISKSAISERKLKAEMKAGTLQIDDRKRAKYEETCLLSDPKARFRYEESWLAWHSRCGKWYKQKLPYDTSRFSDHVHKCTVKGPRVTLLGDYFSKPKSVSTAAVQTRKKNDETKGTAKENNSHHVPAKAVCLGITGANASRLPTYIDRTGAEGGGSRSLSIISEEHYDRPYSTLNEEEKLIIGSVTLEATNMVQTLMKSPSEFLIVIRETRKDEKERRKERDLSVLQTSHEYQSNASSTI